MSGLVFALIYVTFFAIQFARNQFKSALALAISTVVGFSHTGLVLISDHVITNDSQAFLALTTFCLSALWAYSLDRIDSKACGFAYLFMLINFVQLMDFFTNDLPPLFNDTSHMVIVLAVNVFILIYSLADRETHDRNFSFTMLFHRRSRID